MKKSLFTLILAVSSALWSGNAYAENTSINLQGDTLEIVENGDTTRIAGAQTIMQSLSSVLNKEVISSEIDNDDNHDSDTAREIAIRKMNLERNRQEQRTVATITSIVFFFIFLIIMTALLFFYLNRRNKYRVMERAIENGYDLPSSFTGKYPTPNPVVPPMPNPTAPQAPQNPYYGPQPQAPAPGAAPFVAPGAANMGRPGAMPNPQPGMPQPPAGPRPLPGQYNIDAFRGGFIWTLVGFAITLFFITADALPPAILGLVPTIIGLAKIGSEYYKQRSRINYENWLADQAAWREQQAQASAGNPSSNDSVTPPPFNDNADNNR